MGLHSVMYIILSTAKSKHVPNVIIRRATEYPVDIFKGARSSGTLIND